MVENIKHLTTEFSDYKESNYEGLINRWVEWVFEYSSNILMIHLYVKYSEFESGKVTEIFSSQSMYKIVYPKAVTVEDLFLATCDAYEQTIQKPVPLIGSIKLRYSMKPSLEFSEVEKQLKDVLLIVRA